LSKLNKFYDKENESGFENFDDCAIFKLNEKQSIIQTVDFFTPIVDDPYTFGQIAASNSLSDIYAMGGTPLFALNIVAFPTDNLPLDVLSLILKGGKDKCLEANVNILGGHSIKDDIPKYGLAVTGIIENKKILRNNTAKIGDDLILTKPIGTGIISTAIKKEATSNKIAKEAIDVMLSLNNKSSETIQHYKINACTDITGFGLLGHLNEMCSSSKVSAEINFNNINFISGVKDLALKGIIPGGSKNNLKYYRDNMQFNKNIKEHEQLMLADAQTSGGLLISVSKTISNTILDKLNKNKEYTSTIIGKITKKKDKNIFIKNE